MCAFLQKKTKTGETKEVMFIQASFLLHGGAIRSANGVDGWMHALMDAWMDGRLIGWMDGWMDLKSIRPRSRCFDSEIP